MWKDKVMEIPYGFSSGGSIWLRLAELPPQHYNIRLYNGDGSMGARFGAATSEMTSASDMSPRHDLAAAKQ